MNTETTLEITSTSLEDTLRLGERLGKNCKGGEVIVLSSDLGGGKTTMTKGIGLGLGCTENIKSPSFTVNNVYNCQNNIQFYHFDFYRLDEAGIMSDEIFEVLEDVKTVVVIEWANLVEQILPENTVRILLERVKDNVDNRKITINIPDSKKYLLKELSC